MFNLILNITSSMIKTKIRIKVWTKFVYNVRTYGDVCPLNLFSLRMLFWILISFCSHWQDWLSSDWRMGGNQKFLLAVTFLLQPYWPNFIGQQEKSWSYFTNIISLLTAFNQSETVMSEMSVTSCWQALNCLLSDPETKTWMVRLYTTGTVSISYSTQHITAPVSISAWISLSLSQCQFLFSYSHILILQSLRD